MDKLDKAQFEQVLVDVRKAYRLLYLYQRRVMDLVKFIGDTFGFSYDGGYSKYSNTTPRNGSGNFDKWSWDWLNMYHYDFLFTKRTIGSNQITLSVRILSDTGFYDSGAGTDELTIKGFAPVDEATTQLIFVVGKNAWEPDKLLPNKQLSKDIATVTYRNDESNLEQVTFCKKYALADFIDEEATRKQLEDFKQYCLTFGVNFDATTSDDKNDLDE